MNFYLSSLSLALGGIIGAGVGVQKMKCQQTNNADADNPIGCVTSCVSDYMTSIQTLSKHTVCGMIVYPLVPPFLWPMLLNYHTKYASNKENAI